MCTLSFTLILALSIIKLLFVGATYVEIKPKPPHPVIQEFQNAIESDPVLFNGFTLMFDQIPRTKQYDLDYFALEPQVRDYRTMLVRLNDMLTKAPQFGTSSVMPLVNLFGWPLCTQAGFDMFMSDKVNAHLRSILKTWTQFLESPDSRYTLTTGDGGWFGPAASKAIPNFTETFQCNPDEEYHGFKSYDDFFTRKFRGNVRPVDAPDDTSVIANGCESTPIRVRHGVKEEDKFWLKGQPYSLKHMLNNDALTPQFVGGTVFQSFLNNSDYHRWHSPVDGTIVKLDSVPGTYFAGSPVMGFASKDHDEPGRNSKINIMEGFMANVATRLIFFIEADNPAIGLMTFIAVGMGEVSSCEATVKVGERVKKGDPLGTFHYGGSTYCMVFRPETKINFTEEVWNAIDDSITIPLNKRVGVVQPLESGFNPALYTQFLDS